MSGGAWNYQQYRIEELAETLSSQVAELLRAVAETEHLIDWAESGDTLRANTEPKVYDLWRDTFNRVYGDNW